MFRTTGTFISLTICIFVIIDMLLLISIVETAKQYPVPPPPRHHGYHKMMAMMMNKDMDDVLKEIDGWSPMDKQNIWELSGLLEGDIMEDYDSDIDRSGAPPGVERNAVRDFSAKWPGGVVPYHISDDFDDGEAVTIKGAMDEFHENSCIKFRPYKEGDSDWISIKGDSPGCWSYVGRRGGGQVVNLGRYCVQHGVAAHELLHALGFHHQQSASDRDNFVTIHWKNIRRGTERNFKRYSRSRITDLGIGYDYDSVMHYSTHAFSKNGRPTITPKEDGAYIGQRSRLSDKDLQKLNIMYGCPASPGGGGTGGIIPGVTGGISTEFPIFDFWGFHFR